MKLKSPQFLNRYTSLPVLLDILKRREIFVLNPASWEDGNDAFYIEQYRVLKKLKAVLAICFSTRRETFHHWKIFSGGVSGVCIEFDKLSLLAHVRKVRGTRSRAVTYKLVKELKQNSPNAEDWPFLKRWPYKDEGEFRIIYETCDPSEQAKAIPIDLACIRRITLSPWLPATVSETVRRLIRQIDGCQMLKVSRSTLLNNADWRSAVASKSKT